MAEYQANQYINLGSSLVLAGLMSRFQSLAIKQSLSIFTANFCLAF